MKRYFLLVLIFVAFATGTACTPEPFAKVSTKPLDITGLNDAVVVLNMEITSKHEAKVPRSRFKDQPVGSGKSKFWHFKSEKNDFRGIGIFIQGTETTMVVDGQTVPAVQIQAMLGTVNMDDFYKDLLKQGKFKMKLLSVRGMSQVTGDGAVTYKVSFKIITGVYPSAATLHYCAGPLENVTFSLDQDNVYSLPAWTKCQ